MNEPKRAATPIVSESARQVLREMLRQYREANLLTTASSLAYTTILSIIPFLAMSFAIFKAFGGLQKLYATIEPFILNNLAEGASEEVIKRIAGFIESAHASAVGFGGFFGLVFTSMSMLSSIENGINRIWRVKSRRYWFHRVAVYWLIITLGPVAFSVALGLMTSSNLPLTRFLPSGAGDFLLALAAFFGIYRFVPYCRVQWKFALISAFLAAIGWEIAQAGFHLYTRRVVTYNAIYGSLGAVPLLLLWIYIVWVIVLSGAALTASLQTAYRPEVAPQARV